MLTLPEGIFISAPVPRTEHNFIRTYTGRKFWPLNPEIEEISIQDIAHALSLICRWTGHTYCFYSVAEHSLRVSRYAEKLALAEFAYLPASMTLERVFFSREIALWGLLHDASEAYLCDMPSPLKHASDLGQLYKQFESQLMQGVADRFGMSREIPQIVKAADATLLNTEARDLMGLASSAAKDWNLDGIRLPELIHPIDAQKAEVEFLRRFEELTSRQ